MRHLATLLLTLLLAGCMGTDAQPVPSTRADGSDADVTMGSNPTPTAEATDEPATSPSPPPTVAGSQPTPRLAGSWETTVGGVTVTLTLDPDAGTYGIVRGGNSGAGEIAVDGDRIEFFGSSLCSGTGAYTWGISGQSLRFEPDGTDPCSGRVDVLVDLVYGDYTAP